MKRVTEGVRGSVWCVRRRRGSQTEQNAEATHSPNAHKTALAILSLANRYQRYKKVLTSSASSSKNFNEKPEQLKRF